VLVADEKGTPVVSLGFHGRGRVYVWGASDIYRLSRDAGAETVDRLLAGVLDDAVAPLFPEDATPVASYPFWPVVGHENVLVWGASDPTPARVGSRDLILTPGPGNWRARFVPDAEGPLDLASAGHTSLLTAIAVPGVEQVYYEFNPDFLRRLADDAGGRYVAMRDAGGVRAATVGATWRRTTATRYDLASHWGWAVTLAAVAACCWVLRKLAGLAI
jgi:hypothetical protein